MKTMNPAQATEKGPRNSNKNLKVLEPPTVELVTY